MSRIVVRLPSHTLEAFRTRWVAPSVPVVLANVTTAWPAFATWSPENLRARFGGATVDVMNAPGGRVDNTGAGGATYRTRTLGDYVDTLGERDAGYLVTMWESLPAELRADVVWPRVCADARWSQATLWFGPAGIVSPMHFDVADNLYAVVRGRKRFTLFAPRDSLRLYPHGLASGRAQYARVDPERAKLAEFPRFARAEPWVAEVGDGDALYIPRRWWHHTRGLATTLAVNFWWADRVESLLARAADAFKRVRGLTR